MMKTQLVTLLLSASALLSQADDNFRPLFNGKDLTGWDGNPELWSVEDGCITGRTTGPEHLSYNQFLIWRGGVLKNFELKAKVKVSASNSGIQYRSREIPENGRWSVGGYQCDIHPNAQNNGMVYEERGRGIISQNGQSLLVAPDGVKWLLNQREPLKADIAQWHEYTVVADGNHLVHKIDGQPVMDLVDHEEAKRSLEGILAIQLHKGPAMHLQVKDVLLRELPDGNVPPFDPKTLPSDAKRVDKAARNTKELPKAEKKTQDAGSPNAESKPSPKADATSKAPASAPAETPSADGSFKWLWSGDAGAQNGARLRKEFELNDTPLDAAQLKVTCDNGAKVFLNGKLVLTNPDWQAPSEADVKKHLKKGRNEILVEATNKGGASGFVASLSLKFLDGSTRAILTDASWLATAPGSENWSPAKVIADYGSKPWGDVFNHSPKQKSKPQTGTNASSNEVTQPADIRTLPGFKVELIHTVARDSEGSWVGLTVDNKGRLIATDQYGGLHRLTPPPVGSSEAPKVEKLNTDIAGAHGVLYAFDSLYVLVNEKPHTAGLYRLRDTKGTDQFDEKTLLREIKGQGEHGNHSITLSPDGNSLYIACGNSTAQPEPLEHTRGSRPFGDDQVLPRINRGGAYNDTKPMAFTCKVSPDGKRFEMIASGLRNHFDTAFNALGDLFTYDSDMEWDAGTPWYRPTRIYHLVSGGDYGFRESSGKLMEYCPDVVPPIVNVGPGSPTGVVSGLGASFPAAYQNAIYACDWTYGTLYAVHLTPAGAGYSAKLEEFLSGKPLPLTDVVIGKDGAMYFSIGGRRTQSAVYRVTYAGSESTSPAAKPVETPEHKLRVDLERLHEEGTGPEAIEKAWPHLAHPDRLVRYAARIAIERQPVALWGNRVSEQKETWGVLEATIALARMGGTAHQASVLKLLNSLDHSTFSPLQKIAWVRAYEINIARNGLPEGSLLNETVSRLDAVYPAENSQLNTELSRTLVALGSSSVVPKTIRLMESAKDEDVPWLSEDRLARNDRYGPKFRQTGDAKPNTQQIAYAYALRFAKNGWTQDLRKAFFSWFASTAPWQGGNQFRGFIDQIEADALASVPSEQERKAMKLLSTTVTTAPIPVAIHPPKGPGKNYSVDEVVEFSKDNLHRRDFKRGGELFVAAACSACHRLGNEGGGVGPDLNGCANRYTLRDLVENIVLPSKVISDQYESTIIELKNGSSITGRIVGEEGGFLQVTVNPAAPNLITEVKNSDIKSRRPSAISLMPEGLIHSMNKEEVLDLLAYLLSSGDPKNPVFK